MSEQKKTPRQNNILWAIMGVVILVFGVYSFLTSDLKHIEDTNGPDDYSLAVITDENIINQDMGALNVGFHRSLLNDGVICKSEQFSGVYRVFLTNFIFNSDFQMDLTNFYVHSGNFRMCLVNDGRIIADVEPGEVFTEVLLHDLNGDFELVIAGESADFEFYMDRMFCEHYGIATNG